MPTILQQQQTRDGEGEILLMKLAEGTSAAASAVAATRALEEQVEKLTEMNSETQNKVADVRRDLFEMG
jgi:prefoldin subunit 5